MNSKKKKPKKLQKKRNNQNPTHTSYNFSKAELLQAEIRKVSKMKSLVTVYEGGEAGDVLASSLSKRGKATARNSSKVEGYKSNGQSKPRITPAPSYKSNLRTNYKLLNSLPEQKDPQTQSNTRIVPEQASSSSTTIFPNGTTSKKPLIKCAVCDTFVREDRFARHMQKVHGKLVH